jgi:hypothetical protein
MMNTKYYIIIVVVALAIIITGIYLYGHTHAPYKEQQLTEIMNYPIPPDIIKRCQKDFNYTDEDMVILEHELKRYLTLCILKENTDISINMYSEDVDNLWHSFILFTKEYAHFCDIYAGHFLHHVPETDMTPKPWHEVRRDFCVFAEHYEKLFEEEPHFIWFLNMCEE